MNKWNGQKYMKNVRKNSIKGKATVVQNACVCIIREKSSMKKGMKA